MAGETSRAEGGRIEALAFDTYGTLFDVDSVVAACEEAFPGKGASLSGLWRAKQLEYTWLLSLMDRYEDFWAVSERALDYACSALGLRCGPSQRDGLMRGYLSLEPYPDAPPGLRALSSYRLAILSNGSPRMLDEVVGNAGLAPGFNRLISADEVRTYKPSPRVYRLAAETLGVEQDAVGFVSSNSRDIVGAGAFGLWTCWVNRSGAPLDGLGVTPDVTVSSITELADLLNRQDTGCMSQANHA